MRNRLFIITLLITLSACVNYAPAIINNNVINNPSIGFDGYTFTMPDNFTLNHEGASNSTSLNHINKSFVPNDYSGEYEVSFKETFVFYDKQDDITAAFKINVINFPVPLYKLDKKTEKFMINSLIGGFSTSKSGADTETITASGRPGLLVHDRHQYSTIAMNANAESGCFILGKVSEFYFIAVEGPANKRDKVKQYARAICSSLVI